MAPELFNTLEAEELVSLGQKIRDYQSAKKLSGNALLRKFGGLGSDKTFRRVCEGDLAELDLERQLANYRAVWALIEGIGDQATTDEDLYDDFSGVLQVKRVLLRTMRETGNARFILVEGDTATGKSAVRKLLLNQYGQRLFPVEATEVWNDNPNAYLKAILLALGVKEIPLLAPDRLDRIVERLNETRRTLILDEAHHLGVRCLNTTKTLINKTPGEFLFLAYPSLWRRLERDNYDECRQLRGNRLAERIVLRVTEKDLVKMIERRIPNNQADITLIVRMFQDRTERFGNYAFARAVIHRVLELSEGTSGPDKDCWSTAMTQEAQAR